jgi:hypothetical protein
MSRRSWFSIAVLAVVAVCALALTAPVLGSRQAVPKLKGTVGPGFTISLKSSSGKTVKTLKAGKYAFVISDKAAIHNFTLEQQSGGKLEKTLTATGFTGTKTVTLTLKEGKWKYYCSVHEPTMFGFFTVT